jgi:hypothetical protein
MIHIIGVREGQEYEAAVHLRRLLLNLWPDLAQSKDDVVKIFVGFKMYGYKVEDLDLVVIGRFSAPRPFDIEFQFYPRDGDPFVPRSASIANFALVIEVKSHDASGVRFENKVASVRYIRNGRAVWECVTEKNRMQMFEFKKYLGRQGLGKVHVQDLVLFTGLRESDLPKRPHNCVAGDASFERVLNVLGQISRPIRHGTQVNLIFGSDDAFQDLLCSDFPLFDEIEPTSLDRRRMDMIARRALPDEWLDDLGERQIVLRGRGGVGKTVLLLQMAYRAFESRQMRSLVLTFNKALVADLRRTMALLGVPHSAEKGGIAVETAHAFFGRLMRGLGIIENYEGYLEGYTALKATLLTYLQTEAISRDDINSLLSGQSLDFDWDLVLVDEGQDWPADEIEILRTIYGESKMVVSDGVDQFVRESVADWSRGLAKSATKSRRLTRCMRMKANLATFVGEMAEELQLSGWDLEPNAMAVGGKVVVFEGDLASSPMVIQRLTAEAVALGNHPVDMLACVPPSMVDPTADGQVCRPAALFAAAGGCVWDGTSRDVREHFPTERQQLRFVQYDSCRGLEGWATINYALDELWEYKRGQWLAGDYRTDGLDKSPDELAELHASRWLMIPLTRAIDTLVVNVGTNESAVKTMLRRVAKRRGDFIEWITSGEHLA